MGNYTERKDCRVCGNENLAPIFSLGEQYVTNFPDDPGKDYPKGPLDLVLCNKESGGCGLLQMKHTFDQDAMYRKYWYKSGISSTMVKALEDVVKSAEKSVKLQLGDIVIDIGSNDGTTLRHYGPGVVKVGFEPSNLWELGIEGNDKIIPDYFNYDAFRNEFGYEKAKVITAIAMFYDLEDPNKFVSDVKQVMHPDGLFMIQMNYLGLMLKDLTFDNISHEHLEYYSLLSLESLLKRHDLEAFDVETNDVNGGSFRIYIRHKDGNVNAREGAEKRLDEMREQESRMGMDKKEVYDEFATKIKTVRDDLRTFLEQEVANGKSIYIFGASTRGLVVLQYAGIDNKLIKAATDKNPDKFGKYIVGTGIQIKPLEEYRKEQPDYLFVLPYQFKKEMVKQEAEYLQRGGKMIFALPKFTVVDKTALEELQ
ncbi:MAG TPA: class I SAM-dependent methyltransferase [Candidatus Nanoarchaeia archaeon]|nr:class I SAM-dependent methyltransferase [Candidatus Nanoarchaeia archaeon]